MADEVGERELQEAIKFLHRVGAQDRVELRKLHVQVGALVHTLIEKQLITEEELASLRDQHVEKLEGQDDTLQPHAEPVPDKYVVESPGIPCEDNLPICKAACCRRLFALSLQDVREGVIRWNFGAPYLIRQAADGRCAHNDACGRCDSYAARPAFCRRFDCRQDPRIWKDYEQRIPSDEVAALPPLPGR
jgi:hypothetical protein